MKGNDDLENLLLESMKNIQKFNPKFTRHERLLPYLKIIDKFKGLDYVNLVIRDPKITELFEKNHFIIPSLYLMEFFFQLSRKENSNNHLEPNLTPISPSIFLNFEKTTAISNNKNEIDQISKLINRDQFEIITGNSIEYLKTEKNSYNLITSILPIGIKTDLDPELETTDFSSILAFRSCKLLSENGTGILLTSNRFFSNKNKNEKILRSHGLYIHGIFVAPRGFLANTNIESCIILVRKKPNDKI
ncbi:hypothetical protein, partial [Leptospira jelokensis]